MVPYKSTYSPTSRVTRAVFLLLELFGAKLYNRNNNIHISQSYCGREEEFNTALSFPGAQKRSLLHWCVLAYFPYFETSNDRVVFRCLVMIWGTHIKSQSDGGIYEIRSWNGLRCQVSQRIPSSADTQTAWRYHKFIFIFSLLPYFEIMKVALCDFHAVCAAPTH